jgi:hypothetical protein
MTEAEKLFNETFDRWLYATSVVSNFRSTFYAVASTASERMEERISGMFQSMFEDPWWEGIVVDIKTGKPSSPMPAEEYRKFGKIGAQEIVNSSYASLDAAVLVFYHSLLDASVFDYCRATALHAPQDWEQDLKNTQVQLLEIKSKPYDQLLQAKIEERLERLERESLLTKFDRLFARCNPPRGWSPMVGYLFDRERIKRFDDQRHEIVHGKAFGRPLALFQITDENLFYVQQTGMYFMGLVNFRYRLRLDPEVWAKAMQARATTADGSPLT